MNPAFGDRVLLLFIRAPNKFLCSLLARRYSGNIHGKMQAGSSRRSN
jgi:hypothetical protein